MTWFFLIFTFGLPAQAQIVRDIEFPIEGEGTVLDNFGDPRSGGRSHAGVDILAPKMTPILAATDGVIDYLTIPEAWWGYALHLRDPDGYEYRYLHINNDTPGTDDGNGGTEHAFASGITRGALVTRGQHIAWVGDSGNAENVGPHLHFEIRLPDDTPIDPYDSVIGASKSGAFDPAREQALAPTINDDKRLAVNANAVCASNTLIKSPEVSSVYYCGADGKRYVFPNEKVYLSWYQDFSQVTTITAEALAQITLGGNVTYRPGVKLVKIQTDPKVYAVAQGGVLRWVTSPEIAQSLYGASWNKMVEDVPDVFFINYTLGPSVSQQ